LPDPLSSLLEILFVNFKPDAGERLGDEPKPFIFGFVENLGMNAGAAEFLFERFSLGWLVEGRNGNHVHERTLHWFAPKAILVPAPPVSLVQHQVPNSKTG